ncbi:MAG: hypothetical protein R3C05_12635 [Pirellulaceae bacterium]
MRRLTTDRRIEADSRGSPNDASHPSSGGGSVRETMILSNPAAQPGFATQSSTPHGQDASAHGPARPGGMSSAPSRPAAPQRPQAPVSPAMSKPAGPSATPSVVAAPVRPNSPAAPARPGSPAAPAAPSRPNSPPPNAAAASQKASPSQGARSDDASSFNDGEEGLAGNKINWTDPKSWDKKTKDRVTIGAAAVAALLAVILFPTGKSESDADAKSNAAEAQQPSDAEAIPPMEIEIDEGEQTQLPAADATEVNP